MPFPTLPGPFDRALAEKGYAEPTPVQAAVLQDEAAGRDLLVSAQTGSGKTVAFGLAMAETLLGNKERFAPAREPLALVVAPTRELALQVHRELSWLYEKAGAQVVSCVGGMDMRREHRALSAGAHVVVGTPGRLRDHLERGNLDTSNLRAAVLDEADEMLDLGFREDLEFILESTPSERRTLLFSATLPKEITGLARRYQRDALRINTVSAGEQHADIDYRAVRIAPNDHEHAIVNVLRFFEARGAMVFCHTREAVRRLHASLQERGFSVVALSGELKQNERSQALQSLRDGRARVCVATDVAARGIDLPDLGLVIHADLPNDKETLLHRSGRTGRAGRKGICVLLVPYPRRRKAEILLNSARVSAEWMDPPSPESIRAQDQERLLRDPALTEETNEEDLAMARALLSGRDAETIAAAFVRAYRARLPEPEELFAPGFARNLPGPKPERGERPRREREERTTRPDDEPMAWFRINIGRQGNADPRWLIPLLCRRGHVTKKEIGTIRIMDRETKFGIAERVASRFASAAKRSNDQRDDSDADLKIEPADGQDNFAPTTKRERGAVEPKGADRKHGGPEGREGGADRKHGGANRKSGGPERKFRGAERKHTGGEGRASPDGKPVGKKPYKGKSNSFKGDSKGDGRALADKWTGKKKGSDSR